MKTPSVSPMEKHLPKAIVSILLAWMFGLAMAYGDTTLNGENATPSIATEATGYATINVGPDKSVTGTIKTSGIIGTAAHIHSGAAGNIGPAIVALTRTGDDLWSIPAGVVLTDAQVASYNAGELYVDVHSTAHSNGEIRGQLKP